MAGKEFEDFLLRFRKMPKPVRVVYARPRTFLSIAIGIAAFFFLPGSLRLVTRLLISWDIFIALYLLLVYGMVLRSGLGHIKRTATVHGIISFVYNTALVALMVNIAASAI